MGTGTWELGHGNWDMGLGDVGQNSFNAGGLETVKKPRGQLWRTFLVSNCVFFSIL